ncbi:hypothetical protein [Corallococcus aberystwythensis]|uniref:Uncharacterized protein n=1 Tax=Corallococcus aberystwythensis TaxID=2316722 RepID=A0A3A8PMT8_9BACT|nr:hypothetical protein [Corallococcus aberystwythensis]RKH57498.1 hypothetical protein D7W81_31105 [Corallococcus aberystwythensis]
MWRSIRYSADIHYTWVGPPDTSGEDRDIAGPIKMRVQLKNGYTIAYQMYFWCLDAHVAAFKRKFAARGRTDITVRGMEAFLAASKGTLYQLWYWYGARETDLLRRVTPIIAAAARHDSSVRERVNAKNVWGFFALYTWGGYHFDTGIEPDPDRPLNLSYFKSFKVPAALGTGAGGLTLFHAAQTRVAGLDNFCSAVPGTSETLKSFDERAAVGKPMGAQHIDVWALYSERYDTRAMRALYWYCCVWEKLEELRRREGNNSEPYKAACRSAIIDALYTTLAHGEKGACLGAILRTCLWDAGRDISTGKIAELGILKKYYGSHRK